MSNLISSEFGEQQEAKESTEALWKDPERLTLSVRRHGKTDMQRGIPLRGVLESDAIKQVEEVARIWASHSPKGANISLYESPSFVVTGEREFPKPHPLKPQRASITASIYESAIFGELAPSRIGTSGMRESRRRIRDSRLGDLFEYTTHPENLPTFFQLRTEEYGNDLPRFWKDYIAGKLKPELEQALIDCGGSDSRGLAENFSSFILDMGPKIPSKEKEAKELTKQVIVAITHSEVLESFVHYLGRFSEEEKVSNIPNSLKDYKVAYNEGFDIHLDANNEAVIVFPKGERVEIKIDKFLKYLKSVRTT